MSLFDKLEQKIKSLEGSLDGWTEQLGLGYNHFAVLYSLMSG